MDASDVIIREARREDCQAILNLSREITNFHKCFKAPLIDIKESAFDVRDRCKKINEKDISYHGSTMCEVLIMGMLERDMFDAENPNMGCYVAEVDNAVVGYGHYNYTYDLRLGKNMFLQDLYVQEKFRNRLIGDRLMHAIAKKAVEQNIGKMDFVVSAWNPAKNFYKRKGAVDFTEKEPVLFHFYEFDRASIEKIASK